MPRAGLILALAAFVLPPPARAQETGKKYERNVITREEIRERAPDLLSAYEVIQRLRPQFLRTRQAGSIQNSAPVAIKVYVNGTLRGGVLALRDVIPGNHRHHNTTAATRRDTLEPNTRMERSWCAPA
jgi:hypothetical protein